MSSFLGGRVIVLWAASRYFNFQTTAPGGPAILASDGLAVSVLLFYGFFYSLVHTDGLLIPGIPDTAATG